MFPVEERYPVSRDVPQATFNDRHFWILVGVLIVIEGGLVFGAWHLFFA